LESAEVKEERKPYAVMIQDTTVSKKTQNKKAT